ncbi:MAG: small, acid-soluble spore protein, alpha/beta type [Desulfitobacteriaceae bacterium]
MKTPRQRLKRIDPLEPLKMEIAAELGLLEQVQTKGWHTLTAKDAGRIGGLMNQRRKRKEN